MKKKITLIFFLISLLSYSQNNSNQPIEVLLTELSKMKADSLKVNKLIYVALSYTAIKPSMGKKYAEEAILLSKKINWLDGISNSYRCFGEVYFRCLDYKQAAYYYDLTIKSTKNQKIISKTYANIGALYCRQSNYNKALEYCNKSLSLIEKYNYNSEIPTVLSNIAEIYYFLKNYKKSIQYLNKSLKINIENQNETNISNNYMLLANSYMELKNIEKSLFYNKKALVISEKNGNKMNSTLLLANIIDIYFNSKNYDQALIYLEKLIQKSENLNKNSFSYTFCLGYSGSIYLEKAKLEKNIYLKKQYIQKAKKSVNESLEVAKDLEDLNGIKDCLQQISEIESLQGNYKKALETHLLSVVYKDSIYNSDNKETIKNLEDKRTIEIKEKQLLINQINLKAKEKQKIYFISGLFLLAIIGGLLFYQSQNRRKVNEKLQVLNSDLDQANKIKARFFGILNHDLRSPVNNLIHYLQLQKESPELLDEDSKNQIESETLSSAENLLGSMEDILLWSKGQMENFKPKSENVLVSKLFNDTQKHFSSEKTVSIIFKNPENLEIFTDENYLKTIIRNLTGNAIKALNTSTAHCETKKPAIIWKSYKNENHFFLSITDNGSGANDENFKALYDDTQVVGIKTGLGLHLIRDLAKAINCEISVDSKIGEGTTFVLKLNSKQN